MGFEWGAGQVRRVGCEVERLRGLG